MNNTKSIRDRLQLRIALDNFAVDICNDLINRLGEKDLTCSMSDIINILINNAYYDIEVNTKDIETIFVNYKTRSQKC